MHKMPCTSLVSHFRKNIKRQLRELNIPSGVVIQEYAFQIFGGQRGTTFIEGF